MLRCSNSYISEDIIIEDDSLQEASTVGEYDTDNPQTIQFKYKEFSGKHVLYHATPSCNHLVQTPLAGGIKCVKCSGWFC